MSSAVVIDRPGGGGVSSLTGTANQVVVSAATGAVTLSLPNPLAPPGYVGIGATAPVVPLEVNGNGQVHTGYDGNTLAIFGKSGHSVVEIRGTFSSRVYFGNASAANLASIIYTHATDDLVFSAGAANQLVIASGGYVGIGTDTTVGLLTLLAPANASALTATGYSLTGSSALSMVSLAGTINTSGSPDVFKLVITDTARGASTKLVNIYGGSAGTTSQWSLGVAGAVTQAGALTIGSTAALSVAGANSRIQVGPGAVPILVGIATNSVAAAAAEDGGVMIATVDNTLVYYSGGARYKVVGVAFP